MDSRPNFLHLFDFNLILCYKLLADVLLNLIKRKPSMGPKI